MTTWRELERAFEGEKLRTARDALERHKWSLSPAARDLGITLQRLLRFCRQNPHLEEERKRKGPGRGGSNPRTLSSSAKAREPIKSEPRKQRGPAVKPWFLR